MFNEVTSGRRLKWVYALNGERVKRSTFSASIRPIGVLYRVEQRPSDRWSFLLKRGVCCHVVHV